MNDRQHNHYMYTMHMKPVFAARINAQLDKRIRLDGKVMTYTEYIASLILDGAVPKVREYRNAKGNGNNTVYCLDIQDNTYYKVNKTYFGFASYLYAMGAVTKKALAALAAKEETTIANRQCFEKEAQDKALAEKAALNEKNAAFVAWLNDTIPNYLDDPRVKILDEEFMRFFNITASEHSIELLVLIDHPTKPCVNQELKAFLNCMNNASRAAFTRITGLLLPPTMKGTHAVIERFISNALMKTG